MPTPILINLCRKTLMNRSTSVAVSFIAACCFVGILGCSKSGADVREETNADEILLGHFASMTGSEATFGQSTDNGIRLAIDEINEAGGVNGKKVRIITYDDKGDAREAGTAVTRLTTRDHVAAVLGEVASSLSLAGAPVCQEVGVPMVSPSSTNPKVTQVGDKIFRVCFIDPFQGFVCAKFAREHEGLKAAKAAILYDQVAAYAVGLQEEFEKAFTQQGGEIVSKQTYQAGDQDFSAQLTAIRAAQPEVIFIPGYYTDVGNIALQARKLGITVPLLGGDGWDSAKLGEIAGPAINGCFYPTRASRNSSRNMTNASRESRMVWRPSATTPPASFARRSGALGPWMAN
jgi:branched-chain amino acid transport system substrate-binding protein